MTHLADSIFEIKNEDDFNKVCLELFHFQFNNNSIYKNYCNLINTNFQGIDHYTKIPFLPIDFFKTHKIVSTDHKAELIFESSGTTGSIFSKHFVIDPDIYKKSFLKSFEIFYGDPQNYVFLALLPSYLERSTSSLVYMVNELMKVSDRKENGFFMNEYEKLYTQLTELEANNEFVILFGVSFALLDFFESYSLQLNNTILIETGGMKGRKKEITKEELHHKLKIKSGLSQIHSEYGMTELLSQAYSKSENRFFSAPWMKVLIRDPNDPFEYLETGRAGGINIIDPANLYSCSFIETKDLGKLNIDGSFEVLGRFDHSDIRGCNLMAV